MVGLPFPALPGGEVPVDHLAALEADGEAVQIDQRDQPPQPGISGPAGHRRVQALKGDGNGGVGLDLFGIEEQPRFDPPAGDERKIEHIGAEFEDIHQRQPDKCRAGPDKDMAEHLRRGEKSRHENASAGQLDQGAGNG